MYVNQMQAAAELGVSVKTIRRMIDRGEIPATRLGRRQIRIRRDDLVAIGSPIIPTSKPSARRSAVR